MRNFAGNTKIPPLKIRDGIINPRYHPACIASRSYFRYRMCTFDTLSSANGGSPARSTRQTFNLLLMGVFQPVHLPGLTNPRLSERRFQLTYPSHCISCYSIDFTLTKANQAVKQFFRKIFDFLMSGALAGLAFHNRQSML